MAKIRVEVRGEVVEMVKEEQMAWTEESKLFRQYFTSFECILNYTVEEKAQMVVSKYIYHIIMQFNIKLVVQMGLVVNMPKILKWQLKD